MSKKKSAYTVSILKWEKHNSKKKKGHQAIMLSARFFDDDKIQLLKPLERLFFLWLLCRCGDELRSTITFTTEQVRLATGLRTSSIHDATARMHELQLFRIEKTRGLITPQDKTSHDKTSHQGTLAPEFESEKAPPAAVAAPSNAGNLIARYCDSWKARYQAAKSPPILEHHAKMMRTLMDKVGGERAAALIDAYLQMPDSWFLTKSHDIPTLMGNLNKVSQFLDTGKMLSKSEIAQTDKAVSNHNTLNALRRGEV